MHLGCGWNVGHPQSEELWGIILLIDSNENHLQRRRKQSEEEKKKCALGFRFQGDSGPF